MSEWSLVESTSCPNKARNCQFEVSRRIIRWRIAGEPLTLPNRDTSELHDQANAARTEHRIKFHTLSNS